MVSKRTVLQDTMAASTWHHKTSTPITTIILWRSTVRLPMLRTHRRNRRAQTELNSQTGSDSLTGSNFRLGWAVDVPHALIDVELTDSSSAERGICGSNSQSRGTGDRSDDHWFSDELCVMRV